MRITPPPKIAARVAAQTTIIALQLLAFAFFSQSVVRTA
jgi:hypothetical protein